jgi:hypothetical protein
MGKTGKRRITNRRDPGKGAEHWLGHGVEGQDALLFDLDPYLYALDPVICKIASQVSRYEREDERGKAAILLGYDLNPWVVGFLAERFDLALVTEFADPIVEETALRFDAILLDEEEFLNIEPCFEFILRFDCARGLEPGLVRTVDLVSDLMLPGGVALFPIIAENLNLLPDTLGFRNYTLVETHQVYLKSLVKDYGVTEFAKRHRSFYGKEARDLCLKRIYERDFQTALEQENLVELIVATR